MRTFVSCVYIYALYCHYLLNMSLQSTKSVTAQMGKISANLPYTSEICDCMNGKHIRKSALQAIKCSLVRAISPAPASKWTHLLLLRVMLRNDYFGHTNFTMSVKWTAMKSSQASSKKNRKMLSLAEKIEVNDILESIVSGTEARKQYFNCSYHHPRSLFLGFLC